MARPAASPAARLRKLEAALPKAQEAGKGGQKLTAKPMSELLGVKWETLRGWCDEIAGFEESGAFVRGGNGIEYQFLPVRTTRFLIKHFAAIAEKQAEKARHLKRVVGGDDLVDMPDDMSMAELKQLLQTSMQFQDLRERQGKQVDANKVLGILQRVFPEMQASGMRAVQESDPNGRWSPEVRSIVEDVVRKVLLSQQRAAENCLKEFNGSAAQPAPAG